MFCGHSVLAGCMKSEFLPSQRARAFFGAPALALVLVACGGGDSDVASSATSAPATSEVAASDDSASEASDDSASEMSETSAPEESDTSATSPPAPAASGSSIQRLSADEAIANAEANIGNLQLTENLLDIEVLAVGDGSVQTLRNVVDGDKPVLLWFFSPH